MFLRCSYFFPNLSLDVLIDLVLNQKNACSRSSRNPFGDVKASKLERKCCPLFNCKAAQFLNFKS